MPVRITGSHARVWNVLKDPLEIPHYSWLEARGVLLEIYYGVVLPSLRDSVRVPVK